MILRVLAATAACLAVAYPCLAEAPVHEHLPVGPLHFIGANPQVAQFFVDEVPKKTGDVVETWIFYVQNPGVVVRGRPVMQMLQKKRIDCAAKTSTDLYTAAWDGAGRRVTEASAAPATPIASGSSLERVSNIACGTTEPPEMTRVIGNRAAFRLGLQAIQHARERAGG